jgi:hypothetical protein
MRIEVHGPPQPIADGEQFEVQVLVENVEHLAAFEFTIAYDPDRVSYERVEDQGEVLSSSQRGQNASCPDATAGAGTVTVLCSTLGPPVCLGGVPGAAGSGLLATMFFKSKGGSTTMLDLRETTLVLDDIQPCDPDTGLTQAIEHSAAGASVELEGNGNSYVLLASISAAVAVVLVSASFAGFLWYRRRGRRRQA